MPGPAYQVYGNAYGLSMSVGESQGFIVSGDKSDNRLGDIDDWFQNSTRCYLVQFPAAPLHLSVDGDGNKSHEPAVIAKKTVHLRTTLARSTCLAWSEI